MNNTTIKTNWYIIELKEFIKLFIYIILIIQVLIYIYYNELLIILFFYLKHFYYFIFTNLYLYLTIKLKTIIIISLFSSLPLINKFILLYIKPILHQHKYNQLQAFYLKWLKYFYLLYCYNLLLLIGTLNLLTTLILKQNLLIILELTPITLLQWWQLYTIFLMLIFYIILTLNSYKIIKQLPTKINWFILFNKKIYLFIITITIIFFSPDDPILITYFYLYYFIHIELISFILIIKNLHKLYGI